MTETNEQKEAERPTMDERPFSVDQRATLVLTSQGQSAHSLVAYTPQERQQLAEGCTPDGNRLPSVREVFTRVYAARVERQRAEREKAKQEASGN